MSNANDLELLLLDLINDERGSVGLDPLRLITPLNAASEQHSQWMLESDTFSHMGEGGSSPYARMTEAGYPFQGASMALENIGWQSTRGEAGYADDVEDIHESLMQSPGHRANILNPNVEDIGLGVEIGTFSAPSGDFEAVMVTQVFAKTDADVSDLVDSGTLVDDDPIPADDNTEDPVPMDPVDDGPTDEPVPDDPVEEPEIVAENDPLPEDEPRDDMPDGDDMGEEDVPEDELPEEDMPEDELPEDQVPGDDMPDDETPEDEMPDEDVPEEDLDTDAPRGEQPDTETPEEEQPEDDQPEEQPDDAPDDVPEEMPRLALPCGLENFTVDLSGAFEFRQEGDQMIWETSEDKLVAAFLAAFEDWTMQPPEAAPDVVEVFDEEDDEDLLSEGQPEEWCMAPEEDDDEDEDFFADMCV